MSFLLDFYALVFLAYIVYSVVKEVKDGSRIVSAVPRSLRSRAGRSNISIAGVSLASHSSKDDESAHSRRCVRIPRLRNPALQRYSRPASAIYSGVPSSQQSVRS